MNRLYPAEARLKEGADSARNPDHIRWESFPCRGWAAPCQRAASSIERHPFGVNERTANFFGARGLRFLMHMALPEDEAEFVFSRQPSSRTMTIDVLQRLISRRTNAVRSALMLLASVAAQMAWPRTGLGQSLLDRPPNVSGNWTGA